MVLQNGASFHLDIALPPKLFSQLLLPDDPCETPPAEDLLPGDAKPLVPKTPKEQLRFVRTTNEPKFPKRAEVEQRSSSKKGSTVQDSVQGEGFCHG